VNENKLTTGSVKKGTLLFVLPYLLSCFLQSFYGLADLFVVGLFKESQTTNAVSIGSQGMHLVTVMVVGLAMGATVALGRAIGAKDYAKAKKTTGTTIVFFSGFAAVTTVLLILLTRPITAALLTPVESVEETVQYLTICFVGLPFIIAYNVISSIYRGAGDSKSPMIFVGISCCINIALDFFFIGVLNMSAAGAALATVIAQAMSVLIALLRTRKIGLGFRIEKSDIRLDRAELSHIIKVGIPIAFQDGLIQIAFLVITIIANNRGLVISTAVGIVEKVISFMFLVPSAFLSALSAITAQNMGAGKPERAKEALRFSLIITALWGLICCGLCQLFAEDIVRIFRSESDIVELGGQYLKTYSLDIFFAAFHFCFSGYFCGDRRSGLSFIHNMLSVVLVRVPGAYLASIWFPTTLYAMGLAAPMGSLLSALICVAFYFIFANKPRLQQ